MKVITDIYKQADTTGPSPLVNHGLRAGLPGDVGGRHADGGAGPCPRGRRTRSRSWCRTSSNCLGISASAIPGCCRSC